MSSFHCSYLARVLTLLRWAPCAPLGWGPILGRFPFRCHPDKKTLLPAVPRVGWPRDGPLSALVSAVVGPSRPLPAAKLIAHHAWPWCRSSAENQGRLPSGLRSVQVNPKQVCVRDAKRETSTRMSPSKGRLTLPPWRRTGLDIGPAHHVATSAFTWDVGIYDPSFCGRTLQRERLALSSMCFCVKQRYHCFQRIPWGLNE